MVSTEYQAFEDQHGIVPSPQSIHCNPGAPYSVHYKVTTVLLSSQSLLWANHFLYSNANPHNDSAKEALQLRTGGSEKLSHWANLAGRLESKFEPQRN